MSGTCLVRGGSRGTKRELTQFCALASFLFQDSLVKMRYLRLTKSQHSVERDAEERPGEGRN